MNKSYKGIAELTTTHDDDLHRQQSLLHAMTDAVTALNIAGAVVHGVDNTPPDVVQQRLSA